MKNQFGREYDSTLARMAGNIAAGMFGNPNREAMDLTSDEIALGATYAAWKIINICKRLQEGAGAA